MSNPSTFYDHSNDSKKHNATVWQSIVLPRYQWGSTWGNDLRPRRFCCRSSHLLGIEQISEHAMFVGWPLNNMRPCFRANDCLCPKYCLRARMFEIIDIGCFCMLFIKFLICCKDVVDVKHWEECCLANIELFRFESSAIWIEQLLYNKRKLLMFVLHLPTDFRSEL